MCARSSSRAASLLFKQLSSNNSKNSHQVIRTIHQHNGLNNNNFLQTSKLTQSLARFHSTQQPDQQQEKLPPSPSSEKKTLKFSFLSWKTLAICGLFGTGAFLFMVKLRREKEETLRRKRKQAVGKMAIGGPFELVDQDGKTRTDRDFLGQWVLIYFGFTHCPDICPEEMDKMVHTVDLIDRVPNLKEFCLQPLFVTVDPERDTVSAVKAYIADFSAKIIGLTGTKDQVNAMTKAYRVYFSSGPKDEDNDYIVDHTVIMYLVDPEGNFVDYFGQNKTAEEVATAAAIHMGSYQLAKREKKASSSEEKKSE